MTLAEIKEALKTLVKHLYDQGADQYYPRLIINSLHPGVTCPRAVKLQWQEKLLIDLSPALSPYLAWEEEGLSTYLTFDGTVCACYFPYMSIKMLSTRTGMVLYNARPVHAVLTTIVGEGQPTFDEEQVRQRRAMFKIVDGGSSED